MAKKNKVCLTCGTNYSYCNNCNQKDPSWMAEFHSENCKNIFDICTRYNMELLSKADAKVVLEKCDLSNKANFKEYVQRDLKAIFAEDPFVVTTKSNNKKKSHEVVETKEEA